MKDLLPELCDHFEGKVAFLAVPFSNYGQKVSFYGEVVTLRCYHDNSLVRETLNQNGAGKVLLIDGNGSIEKALLGDQLAILAEQNGWQGVIVYGAVRDAYTLSTVNLGIKALATNPFKTEKRGVGEAQVSLNIGGISIHPGDFIYSDWNGVLVSNEELDLTLLG
ncbi:putative 4-hydroxy-4-methyl-2-oxoglutarate aldolase [Vibrio rumoiensis]|uniref:4-hydroxy-4-methyl-2-oxoglutarate aldolase n=1 Tax=Vibrio rumoiensis 1S-45 TaxID=1188252 RepID=A0A1E5DYG3_9VIBR|nr:putative 4-hydroxy-4-methyl-2-oxoglutarate aldolase [Vibrio rumoiensis]OEF22614.1 ribonuclease activity regulator protein RraA [Vibrio rumoiensis 1S-45]